MKFIWCFSCWINILLSVILCIACAFKYRSISNTLQPLGVKQFPIPHNSLVLRYTFDFCNFELGLPKLRVANKKASYIEAEAQLITFEDMYLEVDNFKAHKMT